METLFLGVGHHERLMTASLLIAQSSGMRMAKQAEVLPSSFKIPTVFQSVRKCQGKKS